MEMNLTQKRICKQLITFALYSNQWSRAREHDSAEYCTNLTFSTIIFVYLITT